jgi:hypothetical protein
MADKSVYLNFGADTGKLEADLARANAGVRATAREMQRLAAEMQKTGAAADGELGQKLAAAGTRMGQFKTDATSSREALSKLANTGNEAAKGVAAVGHAGGAASVQVAESIHVVKSLFDEVAAGQNPIRALALEGGRIGQILSMGVSASVAGWASVAVGILAAAAAAAYYVVQVNGARAAADQLRTSSAFGGVNISQGAAAGVVKQLSGISGLSWKEAQDVAAALGAMQAKSAEVFTAIAGDIEGFAKATNQKPAEAAKQLIALFDDPKLSADQLAKALHGLSEAQRAQYERAAEAASPTERQAALQAILAAHLAEATKKTLEDRQAQIAALEARKRLNDEISRSMPEMARAAHDENETLDVLIESYRRQAAAIKAANEEAAKMPDLIRNASTAADQLRVKFDQVLESASGAAQAAKTAGDIETLRAGLQGATGDAATLIRQFEGFKETAKFDVNHWRAGFGSDTTTSASGAIAPVNQATVVSREDAERDLARRIADIQADLERKLGASWSALGDKAKASLTSIAYNYGRLPENVAAAARGGNDKAIADAIAARAGDDKGVNAGRRAQEAANITRDYAAIRDPAKATQARDAIGDLTDQQRKRDDARNGGGAVDRAELANLEAEAAGRADSVEQERRLVAAREQELSLAQGIAGRAEAQKALTQARIELRNRENAATESGLRLEAERLKDGDSAAAIEKAKAAELKLADFRIAQAGTDVAARNAAIGEKEGIEQRYADQARQLSIQNAQQQIADAREETQARLKELNLQLKAHEITEGEKIAFTQAAYAREKAITLEALQSELKLEDMKARDRQRIGHEIETAERAFAQRTRETQLQAADATQRAWNDATRQIGSAFDEQIGGLLKGTTSWADAARNVLTGLTENILKFFVNWGVQDAANFAKHAAINAGWLASDTATQSAATASHVAGAAAQKAVDASTVQSDAARAAAGAYAAVAGVPLIGPVLAPAAAAAAYAGTLAFSSFDIGAWSIPSDQLAMVHRNELVMPAAEAGAFRSMLSSSASGGGVGQGGPNVSITPQTHIHVNAVDGTSVGNFFRGNQREMMRAVNQAVRDGAHLGLRRLAT